MDHDDGSESDDSERINGLINQLEVAGAGEDHSNNRDTQDTRKHYPKADCGDENQEPVLVSCWPALQTATYMTGVHNFVREKHRVQNLLAHELAQAEQEPQDDDALNIELKGDITLYSLEQQRRRRAHKKSPGFLAAVRRLWNAAELTQSRITCSQGTPAEAQAVGATVGFDRPAQAAVDAPPLGIDKAVFIDLMVKVHYLIICPPVDRELAVQNASTDWTKDNGEDDDAARMTYDHFVGSIFELVDIWTETSEEQEYVEMANMIVEGITVEDDSGTEMKTAAAAAVITTATMQERSDKPGILYRFKRDEDVIYDRRITKLFIYMEDLQMRHPINDEEEIDGSDDLADQVHISSASGSRARKTGEERNDLRGGAVSADGTVKGERKGEGPATSREHGAGTGIHVSNRMRTAMRTRRGFRDKDARHRDPSTSSAAARSRLSHRGTASDAGNLLSVDRANSAIAKVYLSKMQVDGKMLQKDGDMSWAEKSRRKKHQRMDSFVLQYHIRQFGTKKLARRNLRQLCQSVSKLAMQHPRIEVFADVVGVPAVIQTKPHRERLLEFRPFICSDFVVPLLRRLCPKDEKLDRWMGNGKVPLPVASSDFLQAIREVCPHVPPECPAMIGFTIQLGRLMDQLERRQQEGIQRPRARRGSIDLDEGLLTAMPLWSCEEEYLIMQVTLRSIGVLTRWLRRSRLQQQRGESCAAAVPTCGPIVEKEQHRAAEEEKNGNSSSQQRQTTTTRRQNPMESSSAADGKTSSRVSRTSSAQSATTVTAAAAAASTTAVTHSTAEAATEETSGKDVAPLSSPAVAVVNEQQSPSPIAKQRLDEAKCLDQMLSAA